MRALGKWAVSTAVAGSIVGAVLVALPSPAGATVPTVAWTPCGVSGPKGADCGMISVPLDHSRPEGPKIKLALSRVKHRPGAKYQGIMLVNPGGPGAPGRDLSVIGQALPNRAGEGYDWIGFDPRGVGASVPSLHCLTDYSAGPRPEYVPGTPALEQAWLRRAQSYATACGTDAGPLLSHLRTTDVAKDMDLIRAALKVPTLNYYGFSYGTYLGQVYATLFPSHVRRMVLDSSVDPARSFYRSNLDQDAPFQRNLRAWWAWVAKYQAVYHLGRTEKAVEAAWYAQRATLRKAPIGGVVGPDEWTDIFLDAGYSQQAWVSLADLWAVFAATADPKPVVAAYVVTDSPADDNTYAVYTAVECTDGPWPTDWATWKRDTTLLAAKAPYVTWANTWFNAPCLFWPAKAGAAVQVDGRRVPPILLVGETLDAATPFSGSLEVRRRFPQARLVALSGGTSHATSLRGNACLDGRIAAYLGDGRLPARAAGNRPDATCAPLPVPVPHTAK